MVARSQSPAITQSIQTRLLVFALALALIPITVVAVLSFIQSRETLRQQVGANMTALADSTAADIGRFLADRTLDVQFFARAEELATTTSLEEKRSYLREALEVYTIYRSLFVTDAAGELLVASDFTGNLNLRDLVINLNLDEGQGEDWVAEVVEGSIYTTDVFFLTSAQRLVVMMIAPIYDAGNAFSGMVAATIDADLLIALLRERSLSSGGDIHVVDEDGRVMLDDTVEEIFDDLSADPYIAVLEETARGFLIGNSEHLNTEAIFAFAPVTSGREEWSVVLSIPTTELDASSNDLAARSILIALTSAIIAGIIAYVTTGGIVQPLRQLTSAAQLISQGHYDAPVPANTRERGDEVGQLARALHNMEAAIDKRNTDLQQLNASLEQRVEQRTEELRGANRELQAAFARVKEAARVKSEFLANVSHELRTPLNAIIGFSDMLLAGMSGTLNEKQQHKVSRLRENGGRLLTLINDLLDITRIEAGRMDVLHKPFAVHTMFERLTQQLEVLAHQKNLEFMVQVDPELPETVLGDEKRLEQIITNLVSNAVKFTPEGSVRVNVQVNNTAREWQIVVADTGIGIPPHALNLIFEEFRQIDGSYARAYKGSGLGLAITRNLVRLMEGKINVSSQIDQGSTFTVTLPLDTADVDEGEPTTEEVQYA